MSFINTLKRTDIFYDLTLTHLELIAALCQERNARAGEIIFEENTPGIELFVIVRGEVVLRESCIDLDVKQSPVFFQPGKFKCPHRPFFKSLLQIFP